MTKKLTIPLLYVVEWIFFFYVLLFVFMFNLTNLVNLLFVDMPWEERVTLTSSPGKSLLIVALIGAVCFIYIKYLAGNPGYRKFKEVIWGIVFGLNSFSCLMFIIFSLSANLYEGEWTILLLVTFLSLVITIQIVKKYKSEKRAIGFS